MIKASRIGPPTSKPSMRKRIINKFASEPKGKISSKYETRIEMTNKEFDQQLANVFARPSVLKQAPARESNIQVKDDSDALFQLFKNLPKT